MTGSGYVIHSLETALKCFYETNTFQDGVLMAVNNSIDCDTVGCIYGQLAGAYYGADVIPEKWKKKLSLLESFMLTN